MPTWNFNKLPDIFEGAPVKLAPGLTLLAGPNNSGKSALLKAMRDDFNHEGLRQTPQITFTPGAHEGFELPQYVKHRGGGFTIDGTRVIDAGGKFEGYGRFDFSNNTIFPANGGALQASPSAKDWIRSLIAARAKLILTDPVGSYEYKVSAISWDRLEQNGRNIAAIIDHLRDERRGEYLAWKEAICSILPEIADIYPQSTSNEGAKNLFIKFRRGGAALPLDRCGTGVAQCLLSLYAVMFAPEHSIVLLDESTHHLHPAATKRFLSILASMSRNKSVVAATHDPTAVRHAEVDNAILIRPGPKKSLVRSFDTPETVEVLRFLGLDQSDLLFGKGVLVIEGSSEEGVLKEAQRNSDVPSDIGIAALDGLRFITAKKALLKDSLRMAMAVISAAKGAPDRIVFLVDGDLRSKERNSEIAAEFKNLGPVHFAVLKRRSLENYFLDSELLYPWLRLLKEQFEVTGDLPLSTSVLHAELNRLASEGGRDVSTCDAISVLNALLKKFLGQGFEYGERKAQHALALYRIAYSNKLPTLKPLFDEINAAAALVLK